MTESTAYEDGDPDSDIVFIGEAPSYEEIRKGKPFVGPAGQLFERCLHSAKISRARCYIINVFETMVKKPKEDTSGKILSQDNTLLWQKSGFTEAGREASAATLERLRKCTAKVIVPLGAVATSLAIGAAIPITKWRGSILPGIDGRKVIPTIHPSACLRGVYEWRYYIMSDFAKVKRESEFPEINALSRKLLIDPSFGESVLFLKKCLDAPYVNTDIEVLGGQVDCFSVATDLEESLCIPFIQPNFEPRWSVTEERELWRLYAQIISSQQITKVNQNIVFDLTALMSLNNIVPGGPMEDPMVAFSVMYPFLSKSLGTLTSMLTDEPYYKDDGELKDSPTVKDFQKRWEYNAKDSHTSLASWLSLEALLEPEGYIATYDMTMNMVSSLIQMMVCGVPVDEKALLVARREAAIQIAAKVKELGEVIGRPILTSTPERAHEKRDAIARNCLNVNSPKQLSDYFYKQLKLKPYLNMLGKESIDDKALARIYRRDNRIEAKLLQDYRGLAKLRSTYLEVGYDSDRRLRCSYNIRGTIFGRLSSQGTIFGTGLNFQNLPGEFRGFLVSDEKFEQLAGV